MTKRVTRREQQDVERWSRNADRQPGTPPKAKAVSGPLQHGVFAFRIFGEDERQLFNEIIGAFYEEFALNHSVDFVQLEYVGIYSLQLMRAIAQEKWDAAERVDRMLRGHLEALKLTKKAREGDGQPESRTTPLSLAMSLLERAKARHAEEQADAEAAAPDETPETLPRTPAEETEEHA